MEPHHELTLSRHLNSLDDASLQRVKDHADAATDEKHESFITLAKWLGTLLGIPITVGGAWKAIKIIKHH